MEPMVTIALRAARKAGDLIVRASDELDRVGHQAKGVADYVTEVDIAAEQEILYQLGKAYPDHAFLAEESGQTGNAKSDHLWVIDPLDGTSNFMRGIPHYCVSIACIVDGRLAHAVVFDPVRQEEFTASRGRGAQLNGHRLRVSNRTDLRECLLGTGIPFLGHEQQRLPQYTQTLAELAAQCMGIRRAGAAALDLAYVAAGRFDGFWETGLERWDIAAGALIIKEAGGLISDLSGSERYLDNGQVVCGNPKIFKQLLSTVGPVLR
ncbi:MAG: inositol monophosphatase [Halieaceae bacterium]|jgi:myo-inositol-1(or 4)-monophosphatase|nr:inositol monophosphatase [Halieaceae bacterium]MDG1492954.1 inositol monophosphatase family protein [Luminiphilus sp.]MBT4853967.1 inositol monophosphatase [Halieaceae bacterium]MBT5209586.1 inositol monophosphatase [Halieaceae bacterium]MBT6265159.1 inositol monophosphatase [Halieaceae bacterium]